MQYCLGVILFCLSSLLTLGQSSTFNTTNWRFSNPKKFGFTVADMDFFDNNKGVAVGANSGIAYTTDGGTTWKYGAFRFMNAAGIETGSSFIDVHFVSSNLVYAVGTNGAMTKSTDGGATWTFVKTPLYNNAKTINSVWFVSDTKGYIGGQHNNTPDLTPKLYTTNDGGATWDSMAAPIGGKTRVGYPNNPNVAPLLWDITAKEKEIIRIIFVNPNLGYISGTGLSTFESMPNVTSTTTCSSSGTTSTGSHHASLFWKFSNGTLIDYSISKERLGYNGIYNATPNCTYKYASNSVHTQSFRAMHIINDTLVLLISQNNNIVIKVSTGPNSFTPNINAPGVNEIGTYQLLNAPTPPINNAAGIGPSIPATNPAFAFSQPTTIVKAANGKLFVPVNSPVIAPVNRMLTSIDTGRTWKEERWLPSGRSYSQFGGTAMELLPSGKFVAAGQNGVVSDSIPGAAWSSNYVQDAIGAYNKIDFADCNNGMAAGGATIAKTTNGGATWSEIIRSDFVALNILINSCAYVPNNPSKAYFATSVGTIYKSDNINATSPVIDPVFANGNEQMLDIATVGNDSVWVCGYSGFSVPSANRSPKVFKSINGGLNWTTVSTFPAGTNSQQFRCIEFPSRNIGYVTGSRDTIWKTTDGGATWNKLPLPTPGVTPQITYTDMFALDNNTVFLTGNGFPRKVIFRTTDGGNTWQDISSNSLLILPVGNFNSVVFHDLNNGYVGSAGGFLVTNDGGASWRLDIPSATTNHTSMSFSPKTVPGGTAFANRKLFSVGIFANHIMEYGNPANLNVSSTETIGSSCDNAAQGTVTINAIGGIAPYTYNIDGGAFQFSNAFSNLTPGSHTITIRDFACGIVTKTIIVPTRSAPTVNAGSDYTIVEGDDVMLQGNAGGNPGTVAWTPAATLTGANTFSPIAKPIITTTYTMTVVDANGCISADNTLVTVLPYCLKVMKAFTPNGDGMNDLWLATNNGGACTKKVSVVVYNRYGNVVYKNDNYQNNWDGTYNGKPVADGTYYYSITYTTITNKTLYVKGDVTILR